MSEPRVPSTSELMPVEDAGYVAPAPGIGCAIREDGLLRCARWQWNYLSGGVPISRERVAVAGGLGFSSSYPAGAVFTESPLEGEGQGSNIRSTPGRVGVR